MFDETFLKQRNLFNNMKDKQMIIDYIIFNVDLILAKLIDLYKDYSYEEADRTSLKNKVYSTLGDFTYLLPLTFTNDYIDDIIYIEKVASIPYQNVIVPYDTSIGSKHFFRYMLFTICMITSDNHKILEDIKFIMYSKINRDNSKLFTPYIYYCRKNSTEETINIPQGDNPNNYFTTTCYMPVCENCIMSRKLINGDYNSCYLVRAKGTFTRDIIETFYYAFSCGLLLAIVTNEDRIRSDIKKLGLRNKDKAKQFKYGSHEYITYCINRRKGLIYNLREDIIKTAIVDIFGDAQITKFFTGMNIFNNYIVKSEKRYKDGL